MPRYFFVTTPEIPANPFVLSNVASCATKAAWEIFSQVRYQT